MGSEPMSAVCLGCDKPIATAAQWADIPEGEGTHLCWSLGECDVDVAKLRCRIAKLERDEMRAHAEELEALLRFFAPDGSHEEDRRWLCLRGKCVCRMEPWNARLRAALGAKGGGS